MSEFAGHEASRARELQEASAEITRLRDLLTDLWNFQARRIPPQTAREQLLWARVEAVVTEGQYGWADDHEISQVEDLSRRVERIEEILRQAAVVRTRDV